MRKLKLDSGETITMPNVIRTVTRSTMIRQYLQFCEEDHMTPLSRSTLFRILEVREASQQTFLSGLDNTTAEGSAGFERVYKIVEELDQIGLDKRLSEDVERAFQDGKRYFKTEYRNHCQQSENPCPDHCRKYSLSEPMEPELQEQCTHQHTAHCGQCDDLRSCLCKIKEAIESSNITFYRKEQQEDLLYDLEKASGSIYQWKAHIMRSANQESDKQDVLKGLDYSSNLIVMDWAMKFPQLRYREKQSDWYGKRGLSWHVSSVVSRDETSGDLKVVSYAHLFDQCNQDWYSVISIIENLLELLKATTPELSKVHFQSDEAGCYHNSSLISAARNIAAPMGITVESLPSREAVRRIFFTRHRH